MKHLLSGLMTLVLSLTAAFGLQAQNSVVSGVVTDAKTGEPVVGAGIMVKGTTRGVSSNADGTYSLKASKGETILCQFFGYKDIEVVVGENKKINFALVEDTQTLEQSVVVGYGTLKKTQLVGAVENISGEVLEDRVNPNVSRSLQGQVSGLNIMLPTGKPNATGRVYIRGFNNTYTGRKSMTSAGAASNSLGTGSSALVLIDGVEGSLATVNPDDIETVSVLKDAASTAVYGARGAFGVVLITTKNPEKDKISVNYSANFTLNRRSVIWEDGIETDSYTWAQNYADFWEGAYGPGIFPNAVNNRTGTFSQAYLEELGKRKETGYKDPVVVDSDGVYRYYGKTNWIKLIYKPYSFTQQHNVSVNASSGRVKYMLTGQYYGNDGIYKVGTEQYNKFNLRSKGSVKVNDYLTLDNNTSYYSMLYRQPYFSTDTPSIRQIEHRGQPMYVPYNPDGTPTYWGQATGYQIYKDDDDFDKQRNSTFMTTFGADLNIIKDVLKIRADYTYKAIRNNRRRVKTQAVSYSAPGVTEYYTRPTGSRISLWRQNTDYQSANVVGTFTPKLGENHDLNLVAGWNLEDYNYTRFYTQRKGLLYDSKPSFELMDDAPDADGTLQMPSFTDDNSSYGMVGFFGRANYTLLRRYIIELSARYDGSSKFPSNKRWGFFPAASVGWRLSEEPWMNWAKSWMDNFKIRANVGSSGNANIGAFYFLDTMGISKSDVLFDGNKNPITNVPSVTPKDLTWEKVTTYDIGLDWDFLRSRLSFSGDYYIRYNDDMIITGPEIPAIYGSSAPKGNYGSMRTNGWELSLSWRDQFDIKGKPFSYSIKGSLWDSTSEITKYYSATNNVLGFYKGKKLGEMWGFRTDGYFLTNAEANSWATDTFHQNGNKIYHEYAGDLKFVDRNGDGKINYGSGTVEDHGDLYKIGNTLPRYQFGLNIDMNWNGFGLNLFFQGVGHRDWYPQAESGFFWGMYDRPYGVLLKKQMGDMVEVNYDDPNWTVQNPGAFWTRKVGYAAEKNVGPLAWENDYYLQNAAYIRLKNLTFSYTIPSKITKKVNIEKLRVYFSGENLFTWSPIFKYTDMFDPEGIETTDSDFSYTAGTNGIGNGYTYPILKTYTFGINITF